MADVLHALLRESAARFPDRIAVRGKGERIAYAELDAASDRLAARLGADGVRAGDRVGLYMDKSVAAVVALYGILKSGACYIPLDPTGALERHAGIVDDCALDRLVAGASKLPAVRRMLEQARSVRRIYVSDAGPEKCAAAGLPVPVVSADEIAAAPAGGAAAQTDTRDLAYILYTSGSTGRPKGVMISHHASLAFVEWAARCVRLGPDDVVSSHAPFHFDLSVFDLYATAAAGATLCLVPPGLSSFPASLAAFIERERITVWYSVPMVLGQLAEHGGLAARDLSRLRTIIFAGEVFPVPKLRALMTQLPRAEYHNWYGPTETNVCTWHRVPGPPETDDPVPIGVPCEPDEIAIVDAAGQPVPRGEIGELYVAGATLMEGYWNDPAKTERAFRTFPFLGAGKTPAYRTGDFVRERPDGAIEFRGRLDHMIKSRGYRIELGEIESALAAHPDVAEAVAYGAPDAAIGRRVEAAVVRREGAAATDAEIKRFCAAKLPAYMIPERIRFMDALPRTSTNKVDRKRLESEAS